MARIPLYIFSLISVLLFLWTGCGPSVENYQQKRRCDDFYSLETSLPKNPEGIVDGVNRALFETTDSVAYYQLIVLKARAKFLLLDLDSAKMLAGYTLKFCRQHQDTEGIKSLETSAYKLCGDYYSKCAVADTANLCYLFAYVSARLGNIDSIKPDIAIDVAESYVQKKRYDLAAYWYWKSLALSDSIQTPDSLRYPSYEGLAHVYMKLRDYEACDSLYDKVSGYYDRMKPLERRAYFNDRGNSYYFRGDYTTALKYFKRCQQLVSAMPSMEIEQNITNIHLGEIYLLLNQTDSASYYLNSSRNYFQQINHVNALYYIDTQLIGLALKQNNLALASKLIKEAVKPDSVGVGMSHLRNRFLEHYFFVKKDFEQAYYYQKKNKLIEDSTRNERVKMRSSEVALKYKLDNALMEREILIRQQENKMLRLHNLIYLLIFITLFTVIALVAYFFYRKRKNEKRLWMLQTDINKLRLDNVRNKISPHFIFNVLNHEMHRFKNQSDVDNLNELIRLIRRNLELADQMEITLADELEFVKSFINLENKSLGNEFQFDLYVDETIDLNGVYVPSMLLYIVVENAVKHSLLNKEGKRRLWIKIHQKTDCIEINLCDNGGGFKPRNVHEGTGTGLKIITRTIQLFNQYNKEPITMNIHNSEVEDGEIGCEVRYIIPKNYTFRMKK